MTTDHEMRMEALALFEENEKLRAANEQLRTALDRLLHETMYKDHPEASEMAIAALKKSGVDVRERG
jgi:regulator of replication initiation timing